VQEGGIIQTKAQNVVNIGEVPGINWSQTSSTVRSVSARARILVAMLIKWYGAATTAGG
jgi:hypothetical protein